MAVDYNRQYVGARYVPKLFTNTDGSMEWMENTYYEPLTIVTYNNSSYISRMPVDASIGNPTQNKEYWALTGNFNAQINALENKVNYLEPHVNENSQKLLVSAVCPEMFGAKGDGITDDSDAIRASIAYAKANNISIYFNKRSYYINTPVNNYCFRLPSNFKLEGNGAKIVIGNISSCFIFVNDTDNVVGGYRANANISISNLTIECNNTNNTIFGFIHCTNIFINNIHFLNLNNRHMIEINSSQYCYVTNCTFENYKGTEMLQIDWASTNEAFPGFGPMDGTFANYIVILGCTFINGDCGIGCHSGDQNEAHNIIINGCFFVNMVNCISFTNIAGLMVSNNIMNDFTGTGIELIGSTKFRNISIVGNSLIGTNSSKGIALFSCRNGLIQGNQINLGDSPNHIIAGSFSYSKISNNRLFGMGSAIAMSNSGIRTYYVLISDNIAFGNTNYKGDIVVSPLSSTYIIGNKFNGITASDMNSCVIISNIISKEFSDLGAIVGGNVVNGVYH